MKKFFSILGGMGTLATESFIHQLNKKTNAYVDQDYLNYVLFNHATIPDRTAYIMDSTKESPLQFLLEDLEQQKLLHPQFIVLACNTAHYFYDELQAAIDIPILHMPRETVKELKKKMKKGKVAVLATEGTICSGVYEKELQESGFEVYIPDRALQEKVNNLIYRDVKKYGFLNTELYLDILQQTKEAGCQAVLLGCTELSLLYDVEGMIEPCLIVDAQSTLVDRTIEWAHSY
ncbi:amino acid racemase [Jeotgalibaca sp. MA1X17-3]|uniref:amino acid racemase n=1 Tax=Jeotgalibaca sp. MA1X17-3 TaxID=2908211 RepID=UPI001F43A4D5|nr:amino acid racemase [Jeotgalibaca sp. MA1X17-3]UJF15279.1 amino acid racemase [Jeotgalibaca sp. MA1X17-3]